jgi:hypothetical protein
MVDLDSASLLQSAVEMAEFSFTQSPGDLAGWEIRAAQMFTQTPTSRATKRR